MMTQAKTRRFSRAPFAGSVALWNQRRPELVRAQNLGAGGLFIASDRPVDEGSLLTLRLNLPGQRGLTVLGKVVRNRCGSSLLRRPGFAVEFVDISPRDRERIDAYVGRFQRQIAA